MNLPTKEECESWSPEQVAHFMCQKQMPECAETVNIFQIDGHRLLSLSRSDISKFTLTQQPQLQKIVQDINKSEGSLLDKLRRLKAKSGPKLPQRDYQGECMHDTERWSDESDEYENPQAAGDCYEPPPTPRVFPPSLSTLPYSRDLDYVDSSRNRSEPPPSRPRRPPKSNKPLPPEPRQLASDDDEDYIDPEKGHQDNYVEPTAKLQPIVYEVPLPEEVPPGSRFDPNTQTKPLPPKVSPRLVRPVRPILEPPSDTEYEVCEPDNNPPKISPKPKDPPQVPKPFPRENPPKPDIPIRPPFQHKEYQSQSLPPAHVRSKAFTADFTRPMIPLPQILNPVIPHRQDELNLMGGNGLHNMDKESDIHRQPWYANTCDRKTAEEILIQSNRDGSFLVRDSSGLDPQQPYTLVVFYNGKVYNVPVRFIQATQQYALGREKKGEERFTSISRIIDNHQNNPLVLIDSQSNTRDTTRLEHAVRP